LPPARPQDIGDEFDGTLWDIVYKGQATAKLQNMVKPDAMVRRRGQTGRVAWAWGYGAAWQTWCGPQPAGTSHHIPPACRAPCRRQTLGNHVSGASLAAGRCGTCLAVFTLWLPQACRRSTLLTPALAPAPAWPLQEFSFPAATLREYLLALKAPMLGAW
jgi:hypothetical protein